MEKIERIMRNDVRCSYGHTSCDCPQFEMKAKIENQRVEKMALSVALVVAMVGMLLAVNLCA